MDEIWAVLPVLPLIALAVMSIFLGTNQRWHRTAAIALGLLTIAFVWAQAYINGQSQKGLREDVAGARETINKVLNAVTAEPTEERRLLKSLALDWADRAEAFLKQAESRKASAVFHIALVMQANFSGYLPSDLARCESMRTEAESLRDKVLNHLPAEARDATATEHYTASGCVDALPLVLKDLKRMALRLPDSRTPGRSRARTSHE